MDNNTINKDLFQDMAKPDRTQALKNQAYAVNTEIVNRPYSEEQLEQFKNDMAEASVNLKIENEKFKVVHDEHKAKVKPFVNTIGEATAALHRKYEESEEDVFYLADHDEGTMNLYDGDGKFLSSRRLHPKERQVVIRELNSGTNG